MSLSKKLDVLDNSLYSYQKWRGVRAMMVGVASMAESSGPVWITPLDERRHLLNSCIYPNIMPLLYV